MNIVSNLDIIFFLQVIDLTSCGADVSDLQSSKRRRRQDDADEQADNDNFNYMFLGDIADDLNELDTIGVFNYGKYQD